MQKYLLIFLANILFLGCQSTPQPQIKQQNTPLWYSSPKQSNATTLYALGEGATKKESLLDALSNLIATLNLSISSEFQSQSIVKEGVDNMHQDNYTYNLKSKVENIQIANYTILHSQKLGYKRYATEIRVEKKELFSTLYEQLQKRVFLLQKEQENAKNYGALQRYFFYQELYEKNKDLYNIISILHALKQNFLTTPYIEKLSNLQQQKQKILSKIHITLKTTHKKNAFLLEPFKKAFLQKNIKISNKKDNYHLILVVQPQIEKSIVYGFILAKTKCSLLLHDDKKRAISSNTLSLKGQSTSSFEDAKVDLMLRLKKKINKEGLWSVLGMKNMTPTKTMQ